MAKGISFTFREKPKKKRNERFIVQDYILCNIQEGLHWSL